MIIISEGNCKLNPRVGNIFSRGNDNGTKKRVKKNNLSNEKIAK
jgi:hypothetical protein